MLSRLAREVAYFLRSEDGPTAVEYATMLALIIIVCIVSITTVGTNTNQNFQTAVNKIGKTSS